MLNVDQAMNEVMDVFRSVTGRPIQPGRTELPPEVDPVAHVESRYRELKNLLRSPLGAATSMAGTPAWAPPANVYELDREVRCEVELPGVPHERINVSIAGDWLIVRGERPHPTNGSRTLSRERPFGAFQKLIALPRVARRDAVEAVLQEGVLCITIPLDGNGTETREVRVHRSEERRVGKR